jgi:hypothetical protein
MQIVNVSDSRSRNRNLEGAEFMKSNVSGALSMIAMIGAAILPLAPSSEAANRAWSARSAVLDEPGAASCFGHPAGDPDLKNSCTDRKAVFLPMSVDAAASYKASIYGRGWIAADGKHSTIWCVADMRPHDGGSLWGSAWNQLPDDGSFGGAQHITLDPVPVFSPGDAVYAWCIVDPNATIFSYGWN